MNVFADSSAFAKRYIEEIGSAVVQDVLQEASQLGLCVILVPEIVSAFNRRLRENFITSINYRLLKKRLLHDIRDAVIIQFTPSVISRSVKLLENNTLRAMDALHVACALEWNADLFLTADQRQSEAAAAEGLRTEVVGSR